MTDLTIALRPRTSGDEQANFVHVTMEAYGGELVITALTYNRELNEAVIVGLCSCVCASFAETDQRFELFCDTLFSRPWLARLPKLLTVERNVGHEHGQLAAMFLSRWPKTHCIKEKASSSDFGWWTSLYSMRESAHFLQERLSTSKLCSTDDFVYLIPSLENEFIGAPTLKESFIRLRALSTLEEQCACFLSTYSQQTEAAPPQTLECTVDTTADSKQRANLDTAINLALNLYVASKIEARTLESFDYSVLA